MYVIGTSGHIDHGKTSLILALTGVDCDRLPEEKERQMTIDIGFASLDVPGFGAVGFVDVPGHERFIRNMVAGAWGIDLGLLVIAADDGWMPQTEDHFRVLHLLGTERIIVAVNKIDAVDADTALMVEEEARVRLAGTPYASSDIARVSSKTGEGIGALKEIIAANLKRLPAIRDEGKPYLFIDRVFAPKGHGTVVTGTLRNGSLGDNDEVRIRPGGRTARVKRIEIHGSAQAEGAPARRTALNLSGVAADDLRRGHVLYRGDFFSESSGIIALIRSAGQERELRNNLSVEILIGTAALKGRIVLIPGAERREAGFPVRIKLESPWHFFPGQPFVFTNPGGYRIIGGGTVLLPSYGGGKERARVLESLSLFTSFDAEDRIGFMVSVRRWMARADLKNGLPFGDAAADTMLASLEARGLVRRAGEFVVSSRVYDASAAAVGAAVATGSGLNLKEIADATDIESELCRLILKPMIDRGLVTEKEGRYFPGGGSAPELSPSKKKLIASVLEKKGEGIELDRLTDERVKRDARDLVKTGDLVSLDGNILYHRDYYRQVTGRIMALFDTREKINVPEAKDAAGLSRKYIIPLLNRIERDGLIRRLGDFRVKV